MKLELCEIGDTGIESMPTYSPFTLKIHRALQLHGLEYTRKHGGSPGAFKNLNPRGQVPVLLVDDEPVFDSTAILRRLEQISERSLVPHEQSDAGRAWLTEDWADQSLNGFVVAARWADARNWPAVRDALFAAVPGPMRGVISTGVRRGVLKTLQARDITLGGMAQCWSRLEQILDDLEALAPEHGFWTGDLPSVADVALYGQLQSFRVDITPWQRELLESHSRLTTYLDRVAGAKPVDFSRVAA